MEINTTKARLALGDRFDAASVVALSKGELDVVWHRDFYSASLCEAVLPALRAACEDAEYSITDDFQSIGTSMGEAAESTEQADAYFATAVETRTMIRSDLFAPYLSPVDLIRLLADEAWQAGAVIARMNGKPMLSGIVRRWAKGGQAHPHIDRKHLPILSDLDLQRRLAVNVYMAAPSAGQGGDIEFWDRIEDESQYQAMRRSDYGVNKEDFGEPLLVVSPGQGDLVAFDAACLHGVRALEGGERVTAACFLGVRDDDYPLYQFA